MSEIVIVGAGLSGMVAAINLAKEGRDVRVLEAAKGIGGKGNLHPSLHGTTMNINLIKDYVGIDISHSIQYMGDNTRTKVYIGDDLYEARGNPVKIWVLDRGSRETSIDAFLYNEALKAGVTFEFSNFIRKVEEVPPGSIIATGLFPEMYDELRIPYRDIRGYTFRSEWDKEDSLATVYWDTFSREYFFGAIVNGLYYGLIFNRGDLSYANMLECKKKYEEREQHEFEWRPFHARAPFGSIRNRNLTIKGRILAGSVSGCMEPFMMFGIVGAFLSGKVAAMAVDDPAGARADFNEFTKNWTRSYVFFKIFETIPNEYKLKFFNATKDYLWEIFQRWPQFARPFAYFVDCGIPGVPEGWIRPLIDDYIVDRDKEKVRKSAA